METLRARICCSKAHPAGCIGAPGHETPVARPRPVGQTRCGARPGYSATNQPPQVLAVVEGRPIGEANGPSHAQATPWPRGIADHVTFRRCPPQYMNSTPTMEIVWYSPF
jgi:hypothetical protein